MRATSPRGWRTLEIGGDISHAAGASSKPHWPVLQVRVAQAVSSPGQSLGEVQPPLLPELEELLELEALELDALELDALELDALELEAPDALPVLPATELEPEVPPPTVEPDVPLPAVEPEVPPPLLEPWVPLCPPWELPWLEPAVLPATLPPVLEPAPG